MLTVLASVMLSVMLWNVTVNAEDEAVYYAPSYDANTQTISGAPQAGDFIPNGAVFSGKNLSETMYIEFNIYDREEDIGQEGSWYRSDSVNCYEEYALEIAGPNCKPEGGWIVSNVFYRESAYSDSAYIVIQGYSKIPPIIIDSVGVSIDWSKIGYFRTGKELPNPADGFFSLEVDHIWRECDLGFKIKAKEEHVEKGFISQEEYNDAWYYVGEDGYMVTNKWFKDSNGWFYLGSEGYMVKNQRADDTMGTCFVGEDGYMVYGKWVKDSHGWSYVESNGYMATNQWVQDSKGYCFVGKDGYVVYNQWVKDSTGWGYAGADGYRVYSKWMKDSKDWCYVDANGYMATNKWVADSKGMCYVDSNGYMVYSKWIKIDSNWYYVNTSGYRVEKAWVKYNDVWYYLKEDGVMATDEYIGKDYVDENGTWIAEKSN